MCAALAAGVTSDAAPGAVWAAARGAGSRLSGGGRPEELGGAPSWRRRSSPAAPPSGRRRPRTRRSSPPCGSRAACLPTSAPRDGEPGSGRASGAARPAAEHPAAGVPLDDRLAPGHLAPAASAAGARRRSGCGAFPTATRHPGGGSPCGRGVRRGVFTFLILTTAAWGVASFVEILGVDGLSYLDLTQTAVFADPAAVAVAVVLDAGRRCGRARRRGCCARRRRRRRSRARRRAAAAGGDRGADLQRGDRARVRRVPGDVGGSARPAAERAARPDHPQRHDRPRHLAGRARTHGSGCARPWRARSGSTIGAACATCGARPATSRISSPAGAAPTAT